MLGIVKAGAILVNVNYRYVEGELRYLFENSDMVALVHERQYSERVANVLPDTPNVKTVLVVDDGSDVPDNAYQSYGGVEFYAAIADSSPERDFGPRSADDIYLLYTGGTTGFPKGVMWRHEDIYRVLFGGTDFATGEFIEDEYDLAKAAAANPPMVRHPIPPMIHGATQSATWMSIFSGQTTVLAPEFNADEVWRTIHEHKVNLLFFTGDAMARPLLDALLAHQDKGNEYDLSSLFLLASTAALFSPSIKEKFLELLPNRVITDSIGSSETGFGGTSIVAKDAPHSGGPRVTIDHRTVVLDDDGNEVKPGSGVRGFIAKKGNIPGRLLQGREEDRRDVQDHQWRPLRHPRRLRDGRGRRQRHDAGPRLGVDQQRRREDLPRGSRGRAEGPPRRLRRLGRRRARSALRPACGRRRAGTARCTAGAVRPGLRSSAPRSRDTKCHAAFGLSTRSSARRRASPTTAGPRSRPRRGRPTTCTPPTRPLDRLRQESSRGARRLLRM